jgi:hypothetical protein
MNKKNFMEDPLNPYPLMWRAFIQFGRLHGQDLQRDEEKLLAGERTEELRRGD